MAGFTLVELLLGLSAAGLALLGAVMLLDQLSIGAEQIAGDGVRVTRQGNGARLLRRLLLDARITTDTLDRFRGDEGSAVFTTLCEDPGGWLRTCRADIAIDRRGDTTVVVVALSTGEHLDLSPHARSARFLFLDPELRDSSWRERWTPSMRMPAALGIVLDADTLVYLVGARRE